MSQHDSLVSSDGVPVLLTVEEAGALLRIGRTKAYAMAREWRETDGRSGLPVIDLGHVLRVPRQALEEMVGAELSEVVIDGGSDDDVLSKANHPLTPGREHERIDAIRVGPTSSISSNQPTTEGTDSHDL